MEISHHITSHHKQPRSRYERGEGLGTEQQRKHRGSFTNRCEGESARQHKSPSNDVAEALQCGSITKTRHRALSTKKTQSPTAAAASRAIQHSEAVQSQSGGGEGRASLAA